MIIKEYGKCRGVCDACGEETQEFDNWADCRAYLKKHWETARNEKTGEWENYCPDCTAL